jgi:hypothetical protein
MQGEGSAVSRAGIRMGLAILAASGLVMVAWIILLIRISLAGWYNPPPLIHPQQLDQPLASDCQDQAARGGRWCALVTRQESPHLAACNALVALSLWTEDLGVASAGPFVSQAAPAKRLRVVEQLPCVVRALFGKQDSYTGTAS